MVELYETVEGELRFDISADELLALYYLIKQGETCYDKQYKRVKPFES
jgi:hypothetical protein